MSWRRAMVGSPVSLLAVLTLSLAFASAARGAEVCRGPEPAAGAVVHGPVLAIDDAGLVLGRPGPASAWVRAPLGRINSNRSALMAAAFGKNATCVFKPGGQADC